MTTSHIIALIAVVPVYTAGALFLLDGIRAKRSRTRRSRSHPIDGGFGPC